MADVGSPLAPGLFQGNLDALNAFAKAVNAKGGVGCRQLVVKTWDSKLDPAETKNGLIDACKNAVALVGDNSLFNPDVSPMEQGADQQPAYTPRIQTAKAANSTFVYDGSNDRAMWTMRKEAKAQGLSSVKVWACSLACYTKAFLATGGADVEGTYLWMQFLPFEEADANPEATAYIQGVGADKADSFGAQAWQAAVLFKQV